MRYFLAHILQFQFHRALSQAAGCTEPLNRCSVFDSKAAGRKLNGMLEMGASRPWQEALEKIAGTRDGRYGDSRLFRAASEMAG